MELLATLILLWICLEYFYRLIRTCDDKTWQGRAHSRDYVLGRFIRGEDGSRHARSGWETALFQAGREGMV